MLKISSGQAVYITHIPLIWSDLVLAVMRSKRYIRQPTFLARDWSKKEAKLYFLTSTVGLCFASSHKTLFDSACSRHLRRNERTNANSPLVASWVVTQAHCELTKLLLKFLFRKKKFQPFREFSGERRQKEEWRQPPHPTRPLRGV